MQEFLGRYMPPAAAEHAAELDRMNALVHWLMLVLFVGWGLYFAYALWRFRASRSTKANYHGAKSKLSTYSEAGVFVVEVVLLAGFSIPAWYRWVTPPEQERNPYEVRVVAEQFAWNVHYPGNDGKFGRSDIHLVSPSNPLGIDWDHADSKDDVVSLNQLHLEVDRPVTIHLSSKDVIHSFFLPPMRVKQDTIPGLEIPVHFTPTETNNGRRWEIACAQLCGLGHYRMRGFLTVESKEEFEAFLAANVNPLAAAPIPVVPNPDAAGTVPDLDQPGEPGNEPPTPAPGEALSI